MNTLEAIWNHDQSRIFVTVILTVICLAMIIKIFKSPEKHSILHKIKKIWNKVDSDAQFGLILIFATLSAIVFLLMFFDPNLLGKSFFAIPIIYMVLVVLYGLTKEIKRHQDKPLIKLPGEAVVVAWTVIVVFIDAYSFFDPSKKIPFCLENTYYLVLIVFFLTRTSKINKISIQIKKLQKDAEATGRATGEAERSQYEDGQIGVMDKITFNAQYWIGIGLGLSCMAKYTIDFIYINGYEATQFGISIYLWYLSTYAGEKEFRRLTRVKARKPIGTKHGQWMVAVWLFYLVIMYAVSISTKFVYIVPKSLPYTIGAIVLIYFFTIIAKQYIKNGTKTK